MSQETRFGPFDIKAIVNFIVARNALSRPLDETFGILEDGLVQAIGAIAASQPAPLRALFTAQFCARITQRALNSIEARAAAPRDGSALQ